MAGFRVVSSEFIGVGGGDWETSNRRSAGTATQKRWRNGRALDRGSSLAMTHAFLPIKANS